MPAHHIGVERGKLPVIHMTELREGARIRLPRVHVPSQPSAGVPVPGSPEAVQTFPRSVSVSAGELQAPEEPVRGAGARRSPSAVSKVAWIPQRNLGQAEWLATGRRLGAIGRCSQWWIGDWIRYGTARWGEKYAEAARVTGYDVASLRNMAWVASQFDLSLRSDKLTWSHHVLLAPLDTEEQKHWLGRAHVERLSVADLRLELRARREGKDQPSATAAEKATPADSAANVCPNCGHKLQEPAE